MGASAQGVGTGGGAWSACGIVTLTTDFGLLDPYAGIMHGVILSRAPAARVVDLTHGVPPQAVRVAAFFLRHARRFFPPGSVHVAVVDPGVGTQRAARVALCGGQAFLAPDNGLLEEVLEPGAQVHELDVERVALPEVSRTFHGRDVFAPAAALLALGRAPAELARGRALAFEPRASTAPLAGARRLPAEVLLADRFGNLVLALRPEQLEGGPECWRVEAGGERLPIRATYGDVRPGELVALVDSYGALEVAVRDGSAALRLGLSAGDRLELWRTA